MQQPIEETYSMISVATVAELGHAEPEEAEGWTQEDSFPEPIAELSTGNLYDRRAVLHWLIEHGHKGLEVAAAP
jgi:hypothetical protein